MRKLFLCLGMCVSMTAMATPTITVTFNGAGVKQIIQKGYRCVYPKFQPLQPGQSHAISPFVDCIETNQASTQAALPAGKYKMELNDQCPDCLAPASEPTWACPTPVTILSGMSKVTIAYTVRQFSSFSDNPLTACTVTQSP